MTSDDDLSRRQLLRGRFLAGLAGALSDALVGPESARASSGDTSPASDPGAQSGSSRRAFPVHRPPGAVDEATFLRDCTRCDACVEACPHDSIVHAPARLREVAGTPVIDPARQPCWMCSDTPCVTACEPGVLRPDLPLTMGRAMIIEETCLAHQSSFCTVCSEQCPVEGAIVLTDGRPRIEDARCTGCGVCFHVCPAPSNSVIVMPLLERPPSPAGSERISDDRD
ncbi:MAG: 4Fe-4S dicluster domain-containing protein [Planctomycetota bacterium]|jgi:ferredoxin-type protein NapG